MRFPASSLSSQDAFIWSYWDSPSKLIVGSLEALTLAAQVSRTGPASWRYWVRTVTRLLGHSDLNRRRFIVTPRISSWPYWGTSIKDLPLLIETILCHNVSLSSAYTDELILLYWMVLERSQRILCRTASVVAMSYFCWRPLFFNPPDTHEASIPHPSPDAPCHFPLKLVFWWHLHWPGELVFFKLPFTECSLQPSLAAKHCLDLGIYLVLKWS